MAYVVGTDPSYNKLMDILGIPEEVKEWEITSRVDDAVMVTCTFPIRLSEEQEKELGSFKKRYVLMEINDEEDVQRKASHRKRPV